LSVLSQYGDVNGVPLRWDERELTAIIADEMTSDPINTTDSLAWANREKVMRIFFHGT